MRQAIVTRYLGPTNLRGSRIKAECDGGSQTFNYRSEWPPEQNHAEAAKALVSKMGWTSDRDFPVYGGAWVAGGMPKGNGATCWVYAGRVIAAPGYAAMRDRVGAFDLFEA